MSLTREIELTCPVCGEDYTATIWSSVNATLSPELKTKICDGTLNEVYCSHCGFDMPIPGRLLYHDMGKGLMFYVWPSANDDEKLQAEKQGRRMLESEYKVKAKKMRIYILDSMAALKQILEAFDYLEESDGSHRDFSKPEDWQKVVDVILMPAMPWPLDHTCVCGEPIAMGCWCEKPEVPLNIASYEPNVPPDLQLSCWKCGLALVGFNCMKCNQTYQWSLGVVDHATSTNEC